MRVFSPSVVMSAVVIVSVVGGSVLAAEKKCLNSVNYIYGDDDRCMIIL